MTIKSVGQSEAISNYIKSTNNTSNKNTMTADISDSVELSEGAKKYSEIMKAAKEALEKAGSDEEIKAADIMTRLKGGSYQVSSDDVVKDILNGYPSNS